MALGSTSWFIKREEVIVEVKVPVLAALIGALGGLVGGGVTTVANHFFALEASRQELLQEARRNAYVEWLNVRTLWRGDPMMWPCLWNCPAIPVGAEISDIGRLAHSSSSPRQFSRAVRNDNCACPITAH